MERTQRAAAAAIQPSAPRRQWLFLDKEREVQLLTLPGLRGAPLQGGERGCRPLLVSSSHRLGGQVGTVFCAYLLPPSPAGLHRSLDFFFPALSPSIPKRLTPNRELFCCAQQEGSLQGRCPGGEASVSSVTQSCPTFCNPMDCSTPRFSVHH